MYRRVAKVLITVQLVSPFLTLAASDAVTLVVTVTVTLAVTVVITLAVSAIIPTGHTAPTQICNAISLDTLRHVIVKAYFTSTTSAGEVSEWQSFGISWKFREGRIEEVKAALVTGA